jgi:vitamin K-dependent gamma-carboxylase
MTSRSRRCLRYLEVGATPNSPPAPPDRSYADPRRRWRATAWLLLLTFHTLNSRLFGIGVFPWLMLWLTPTLLPPETLRDLGAALRGSASERRWIGGFAAVGALIGAVWPRPDAWMHVGVEAWGFVVLAWLYRHPSDVTATVGWPQAQLSRWALGSWFLFHLVLPLRHLAIPGDVAWTEEGHRYAWRMLLRDKRVEEAAIEVTDPATGQRWYLRADEVVTPAQADDTFGRPDLALAAAHEVARRFAADGHPNVAVRIRSRVSLNGRPPTLLLDPDVDLTKVSPHALPPAPWIRPSPR